MIYLPPTPEEWAPHISAPSRVFLLYHAEVEARKFLRTLPDGIEISTVEVLEVLYPIATAPADAEIIKQRSRIAGCLVTLGPTRMTDCCRLAAPRPSFYQRHPGKVIYVRPRIWFRPEQEVEVPPAIPPQPSARERVFRAVVSGLQAYAKNPGDAATAAEALLVSMAEARRAGKKAPPATEGTAE